MEKQIDMSRTTYHKYYMESGASSQYTLTPKHNGNMIVDNSFVYILKGSPFSRFTTREVKKKDIALMRATLLQMGFTATKIQ